MVLKTGFNNFKTNTEESENILLQSKLQEQQTTRTDAYIFSK